MLDMNDLAVDGGVITKVVTTKLSIDNGMYLVAECWYCVIKGII